MKNFIKELYYGNIDPQARGFKNGSYLKKQITILSENEALLTDKLTGDEKKAFLSFVNASDIILGESELDSFEGRRDNECQGRSKICYSETERHRVCINLKSQILRKEG